MLRQWVRMIGPFLAAAGAVATTFALGGGWGGMAVGAATFLAISVVSERVWRAGASPEEIRRDLEDRLRNPP
jgi:hypothetical protein